MRSFAQTYPDEQFVQQVAAQIPWFHHCVLLDRVKEEQERAWYIQQTIEHGWSRYVLEVQIETGLFQRKGKALTNFKSTLPSIQSDQIIVLCKHSALCGLQGKRDGRSFVFPSDST